MDFSTFNLEKAGHNQVQAICDLVNLAYRGDAGWTTEALIMSGDRTNRQEVISALFRPEAHFLVINHQNLLASCIFVAKEKESAFIGFFAVHPDLQGNGLGKYVLQQAEIYAKTTMKINRFHMFVISHRHELIEFYQRRGYRRTGRIEACPLHLGIPRITNPTVEYLEKIA